MRFWNNLYQVRPGTPASSTTKTGRHDIAEILLRVVLNTKNQINHLSGTLKVKRSETPTIKDFLGAGIPKSLGKNLHKG